MKSSITNLEHEIATKSTKIEELQESNKNYETQINEEYKPKLSDLENITNENNTNIEALVKQLEEKENVIKGLQAGGDEKENSLKEEKEKMEEKLFKFVEENKKLVGEVAGLETEVKHLKKVSEDQLSAVKARDEEIIKLNNAIKEWSTRCETLQTSSNFNEVDLAAKLEEIAKLKKDLDNALMENARTYGRITEQVEEIAELETKLEKMDDSKAELILALQAKKSLQDQVKSLETDKELLAEQLINSAKSGGVEIEKYLAKIRQVETSLAEKTQEVEKLTNINKESLDKIMEFSGTEEMVTTLQKRNGEQNESLQKMTEQNRNLRRENQIKDAQIKEYKEEFNGIEENVKGISNENAMVVGVCLIIFFYFDTITFANPLKSFYPPLLSKNYTNL